MTTMKEEKRSEKIVVGEEKNSRGTKGSEKVALQAAALALVLWDVCSYLSAHSF